ncbi:MAG: sulfite dehydrogenase [Bryobacterales bacterium]
MPTPDSSRRKFLALTATSALAACSKQESETAQEAPSRLGAPVSAYGGRSPHENATRLRPSTPTPEEASSLTPLADSQGIITPSALHFERHHSGVPDIDPDKHQLTLHGLVERPLTFSMSELERLPSASLIYFVECSGNSRSEWGSNKASTVQVSHGMASCSEWTGVPLKLLLAEAGIKPEAKWLICEGGDACRMSRSLPVEKALDDCLVAYGQNGEAIRPEQGYPLRLIVPGWEGNINVKWLRRIKAVAEPAMARDETAKYTDLLEDGKARQFTFAMEAKSVITYPSGGQSLSGPGFYEVRGLAWSGRGRIEKVEISTDGGETWQAAEVQEPRLPKAFTRFRMPWRWEGGEVALIARAIDDTGYIQPTVEELIAVRGKHSDYHNNGQKLWKVGADGKVTENA